MLRLRHLILMFALISCCVLGEEPKNEETKPVAAPAALYQNMLEKAEEGKAPDDCMVLSGEFKVKKQDENKVLELPGAPLPDTPPGFGMLFGPTENDGLEVTVRVFAEGKGRRPMPTFAVGLNGATGYLLQVTPKSNEVQLIRNDGNQEIKAKAAFTWKSGAWTMLRMRVVKAAKGKDGPDAWIVEGKAWIRGEQEPEAWTVTFKTSEKPDAGRASIWGNPYSGMPILYDDLKVTVAE